MTEITLHLQTMMSSIAWGCLATGGTGVEGAFCAMVTKIQANVAMGGGSGWKEVAHQDSGDGRDDPLPFSNLDLDDIFFIYC